MHAYSEMYVESAQRNLGYAFDYLLDTCELEPASVTDCFIKSGFADLLGKGCCSLITCMGGIELANRIMNRTRPDWVPCEYETRYEPSQEYWAGWALAFYQWYCARSFRDILSKISLHEILSMYHLYHQVSLMQFAEDMETRYRKNVNETNLKLIRQRRGMSQSDLAEKSGVKLRSIQLYEQRVNNIDKAQAHTLFRLAYALGCRIEDLLEDPIYVGEVLFDRQD